jgi:NADH:ubiquinone oxidoreductase subunit 5 (subunit L)/multisubunit Na+/H+ antiporter MnhA subunit
MYYPLVVLAAFAIAVGWKTTDVYLHPFFGEFGVQTLLDQAQPLGTLNDMKGVLLTELSYPNEHGSHVDEFHKPTEIIAISTALAGFLLAVALYGLRLFDPGRVRDALRPIYTLLIHKWYFDEIYNALFVQPVLFISRRVAQFDRVVIDGIVNGLALLARGIAAVDDVLDRYLIDGLANGTAGLTYAIGLWFRGAETGKLRQYVMFIVIATVTLFLLVTVYLSSTLAGS